MSLGRPPTTTREEIERVALGLFAERGFEATTVEDIATGVGVGRRTLFRYFESKNDIAWGDFDWVMGRLREALDEGAGLPLMEALRRGVVESNRYPADQEPGLRTRMTLITGTAALQAHSALRYAEWRGVVATWAAGRRGEAPDDLVPRVIGSAALGSAMASFERWVASEHEDLLELLDAAFVALAAGFATVADR
ncbi:MAG TPA: mycofactocin system transcriptional regulator [Solirubrobacterales bacterium]|jgi:mycofactocin system transcriptional regulator|nr:mycofactocin system transcriptional regulator [Solirubrobacterales bacterium]